MVDALAQELVNAAKKSLANSLAVYRQLPSNPTIGNLQPVNSHNISCGTNPQDTAQAQQYLAALTWAMQGCQTAAQQAVEAAQYIASLNPSAHAFAQAAQTQLVILAGPHNQGGGSVFWATAADWSSCSNTNGGQCDAGNISCSPSSNWMQNIALTIVAAQAAVTFAENALALPMPPPPPPAPVYIRLPPRAPVHFTLGAPPSPTTLDAVRAAAAQVQSAVGQAQAAVGQARSAITWSLGLSIFAAALATGTLVYVVASKPRAS